MPLRAFRFLPPLLVLLCAAAAFLPGATLARGPGGVAEFRGVYVTGPPLFNERRLLPEEIYSPVE